jgi:hypothetical protein
MKKAACFAVSLALCSTSAFASSSAMAPGKPAGVHEAQSWDTNTTMVVGALALTGLAIALAVSVNNAGGPTTSTSGSSSTTTTGTTS